MMIFHRFFVCLPCRLPSIYPPSFSAPLRITHVRLGHGKLVDLLDFFGGSFHVRNRGISWGCNKYIYIILDVICVYSRYVYIYNKVCVYIYMYTISPPSVSNNYIYNGITMDINYPLIVLKTSIGILYNSSLFQQGCTCLSLPGGTILVYIIVGHLCLMGFYCDSQGLNGI